MSDRIGITELLAEVGDDNVQVQNIVESATNFQSRKDGSTAVTFLTDQITPGQIAVGKTDNIGLVVWIPRALANIAQENIKRRRGK